MKKIQLTVPEELDGVRIDKAVSVLCKELSRSFSQKLLESDFVFLNSCVADKSVKVYTDDIIEVNVPDPVPDKALPENIPLDIVYEDDDILVVNKPKGMVVHPGAGNPDKTLVNALLYHCGDNLSGIGGVQRPGIVHRIDKDTSGLLMVAKTDSAHASLSKQIKDHSFKREYRTVVHGNIKDNKGKIEEPIGRNPKDRKKMAVTERNSRNAVTEYEVIERFKDYTYLRVILYTGRTHQIRVHMAYIGHPVAGDRVYGPKNTPNLNGQCLHAAVLGFVHPSTGEYMEFTAENPLYFENFLNKLKKAE